MMIYCYILQGIFTLLLILNAAILQMAGTILKIFVHVLLVMVTAKYFQGGI